MKKVLIVHVPYEHRGGEDVHVEVLAQAYERLGYEVDFLPKNRSFQKNLLWDSLNSLSPSNSQNLGWEKLVSGVSHLHLHNLFPLLGARFLSFCAKANLKTVMTVHNHRFFCTNGLALRDGNVCRLCLDDPSVLRPILSNCNQSLQKSIYHALSISRIRSENLYEKSVQKFIAPSPYIADQLKLLGISENKIKVILNPVQKTTEPPGTTKVNADIFYAGRLSPEKGIPVLVEVAKILKHRKVAIAGDGPLKDFVQQKTVELPNLKYLGSLNSLQVKEALGASQVSVLPSICNEILPSFVLESYFWGKPCVIPDLDSTRWLSSNGFPGFLAKPGDSEAFVRAINQVFEKLESDPQFAVRTMEKNQETFGFDRFCRELNDLVNQASSH